MALLPLRTLADRPVTQVGRDWLDGIAASIEDGKSDRTLLCRRVLTEICYPAYASNWETAVQDPKVPVGTRLALAAMDPRNVTLEPEYYADCDQERFQRVKPLLT